MVTTSQRPDRLQDLRISTEGAPVRESEILSSAAIGIDRAAQKLGQNVSGLLTKYELLPTHLNTSASNSIPLKYYTQLLEEAAQETGEDHFGLLFGLEFNITDLGPNAYLLHHARTVGDALQRFSNHFGLLQEESCLTLDINGEQACVCYQIDDPRVKHRHQDAEFTMIVLHNFFQNLLGKDWRLKKVDFSHAPKSGHWQHNQLFDAEVGFKKDRNAFYISRSLLDTQLSSYDPLLLRHLEDYFSSIRQSRRDHNDLTRSVTLLIEKELENGDAPSIEEVASSLGMGHRSLRRRLASESTSYRDVLLDCRLNSAKIWLRDTDISLMDLALKQGYSDASAFSRAFKKKFGIAPIAWRNRLQHCAT